MGVVPPAGALIWSDEFDGAAGTAPSSANWSYHVGRYGAGNGENQYYTNSTSNCRLDGNSCLEIVARNEPPPDAAASPNDFTSARIHTLGKQVFNCPCRIVARAKVPWTKGLLPAFWTVGQADTWPSVGEIDFYENPSHAAGSDFTTYTMNIHGPTSGSPNTDKSLFSPSVKFPMGLHRAFYEYGADWYADRIVWHVDRVVRGQVTQAQYEAAGGDWSPFGGASPQYLLLNVAVGANSTGDPDGTSVWPQSMLVDWVRVYGL